MKRLFDIVMSVLALLVLSPLLLILSLIIMAGSRGGPFFTQERIGLNGKPFLLVKFRTMRPASEKLGLLSLGSGDPRITPVGRVLRKYKLDELPQLLNILAGQMSIVGPRPEVRKYVERYDDHQKHVLSVRPGLTDFASLEFFDEGEMLSESPDPEQTYIREIMPRKLELALRYVQEQSMLTDLRIICRTLRRIIA